MASTSPPVIIGLVLAVNAFDDDRVAVFAGRGRSTVASRDVGGPVLHFRRPVALSRDAPDEGRTAAIAAVS
jgi:hypothetical protein